MGVSDQVRAATRADEKKFAALMGLSFSTDPAVKWALPDPHDLLKFHEEYIGLSFGPAIDNGSALVIGNMCGAALWRPEGVKIDSHFGYLMDKYFDPVVLEDFARIDEELVTFVPVEPHRRLIMIAVDPAKRGKGYGAALMSHTLELCDRDKRPVYLTSTNAANLSFYRRFGFEVLAEVQIGQSPVWYPMLRQPK